MNINNNTNTTTTTNTNTNFVHPLIFSNESGFTDKVESMLKTFNTNNNKSITDSFVNVLMIAEKPSIARLIGDVVSNGNARIKKGARGKILINFNGIFKGIKARYTISAVAGHIYTSDFLKEHNKWNAIDHSELYNVPTIKLEATRQVQMPIGIRKLAKGKDIICLWLDCDKEGENICYEVLYNALLVMNKKNYQQIYRAKFSSLTKTDLQIAFNNLNTIPNKNESLSVDCRQIIDLKIGVSFTRFLTSSILPGLDIQPQHSSTNNNNNKSILSYGPCQTPCLWFCVNRHKEKENFKPEITYQINANVIINNKPYKVQCMRKPHNIKELNEMKTQLNKPKTAKVKNISTKQHQQESPDGLNTVGLLKLASSALKMSPHYIMLNAEKLYTMGYITYPRTETTKYSSNFDFIRSLKSFENHPIFNNKVKHLLDNFKPPSSSKGIDIGDHPPITPSRVAFPDNIDKDLWNIYELICNYYFTSLSSHIVYEDTTYTLDINGIPFEEKAITLKEEGYLYFNPHDKCKYTKQFPVLTKGTDIPIQSINYDEVNTVPQEYLTESDLIKEMDVNKIGTDASMAVHIENICQRGYVKVDANRKLVPTKLGIALIEALSCVVPEIVQPGNRAKIEGFVNDVARGKKSYQDTLKYALGFYKEKFAVVKENYDKLLDAFKKHFNVDVNKIGKAYRVLQQQNGKEVQRNNCLGKCGKCNKGMICVGRENNKFWKGCYYCKNKEYVLENAEWVDVNGNETCRKCGYHFVVVRSKVEFQNGKKVYSGCLMCDPKLVK